MIRAIIADDEPAAGIIIRHLVQKARCPSKSSAQVPMGR